MKALRRKKIYTPRYVEAMEFYQGIEKGKEAERMEHEKNRPADQVQAQINSQRIQAANPIGKMVQDPPQGMRKINGPPTNRQINDNIHNLPVPTLVQLYNEIRFNKCNLNAIQRAIVINKVKEYIKLGIITIQPDPPAEIPDHTLRTLQQDIPQEIPEMAENQTELQIN